MNSDYPLHLLKNCDVYAPEHKGERDILICGEKIIDVDKAIEQPSGIKVRKKDLSGKKVLPGLIDLHTHTIGGGGEGGPRFRVPELPLSEIIGAGITTLVGVLGTDNVTRHLESLLGKTKALNENITSFMYTGSYQVPSPSITESVKKDIALLEEVVGVKVAISDHRSSQLSAAELKRLASEARTGGIISGKPGLVHLHVGRGEKGLQPIFDVLNQSEIPPGQFLPTHISASNGLIEKGIELIKQGGAIDVTAPGSDSEGRKEMEEIVKILKEEEVGLDKVTLSSDGNGSFPDFDEEGELRDVGRGKVSTLWETIRSCVQTGLLDLSEGIRLVSENPAQRIGISEEKGKVTPGRHADLLVVGSDLEIESVYGKGQVLMEEGEIKAKGFFE